MISKKDDIRRITCADMTITQVIKGALTDNLVRIPFTGEGGFISTEIGESDDDDHIRISVTGFMNQSGQMLQTITVIYFDTISEARKFMRSPEGKGFDDPYGQGQDNFEFTTYAGNSRLPGLIVTILQNYFGFKATLQMVAHTHCEVDYFRKDPDEGSPKSIKS